MAEAVAVVGLIASILGIIDGIDISKTTWKKYLHTSSSLRAELLPILGKLTAFAGILRGLQLQCELDEADDDRLRILDHIEQPLRASEQSIRLLSARLDHLISFGRVSFTFGKVFNKETKTALHILDQAKSVLDLALASDQRTLAKSIEIYVRNVAEQLHDARLEGKLCYEGLKDQLHEINARDTQSLQVKTKADILAWICQINYSSNYHAARQLTHRTGTSGDWFINGKTFGDWCEGGVRSRLLLTGISGCGKTVLCARAIECAACMDPISNNSPMILYFFFDFNDAAKESLDGMIRALLHQLVAKLDTVPDIIKDFYADHQSSTSNMPSTQDWMKMLCCLLRSVQNAFIFIDAMDECAEADLSALPSTLAKLFAQAHGDVRWFLTCRTNGQKIADLHAQSFSYVEMEARQVDRDIENFLSTILTVDPKLSSFSKEARECIITEIKSKSYGMFRYAQCQLASIAKLRDRRVKKVKDALRTMPQDLFDIYRHILSEAQKLDDWPIIERILVLVSFSARPVTIAEVAEFAILENDMASLDAEDRFDINDTLAAISPLITVRDGIMTLAHKSVQDFITYDEIHPLSNLYQNADGFIASRCLQYLRFAQQPIGSIPKAREEKEPNTTQLNKLLREYPFLDYAATRWPHHLKERVLQKEKVGIMAATLPLKSKPNLWKAWLLLQRADIWENQIQLARVLCESFIRASLVTGWSDNFWQERQTYRIRVDAHSQCLRKPVPFMKEEQLTTTHDHSVSSVSANSHFWVQAMSDQLSGSGMEKADLQYQQGDRIFIHEMSNREWWKGSLDGQTGWVLASKVNRCTVRPNIRVTGTLYHDLAILLIEVAFQASLFADVTRLWTTLSSDADLARYLAQLKLVTIRVTDKMGAHYGKVIQRCLSKVRWLHEDNNAISELYDMQDEAMTNLCKPLEVMLASGFRASRSPVKRASRPFQQLNFNVYPSTSASYSATTSVEHISLGRARSDSPISAPFRSTTSVISYESARYEYNSLTGDDHAASAEARYFGGLTVPLTTPSGAYRPKSTSAVTISYTTSTSTQVIARLESPSTLLPFATSSTAPDRAMSAPIGVKDVSLLIFDNAMESNSKDDNDDTLILTKDTTPAEASKHLIQDEVLTIRHPESLVWKFPNQLSYSPISDIERWPKNIAPSDDQIESTLKAAHQAVLLSNNIPLQLQWARRVLAYVDVAESNRIRAKDALFAQGSVSERESWLRQYAIRIITSLVHQGHPEAVYVEAKWSEFGLFGFDVDQKKCFEGLMLASSKSYARAWYSIGFQFETSGDVANAIMYYDKAVEADDAAALYRKGMMTILGHYGQIQDVKCGMEMLYKAAERADHEASHALYTLGMIYAHKLPQLEISNDVAALDCKRAINYLERAACLGLVKAQLELGSAYELGELGLEFNLSLALHYYILAARRGEALAEMGISRIMRSVGPQIGKPADGIEYAYAKRAAIDNLPVAQYTLGHYYEHGIHVTIDLEEALV